MARSVLVLAAASLAAARPLKERGPILFLHLHKAGGTSFCELFRSAGLRTRGGNKAATPRARCLCEPSWIGNLSAPHDARHLAKEMARLGLDVCMIEAAEHFPPPETWRTFGAEWRAEGGVLATSLRDPWERFKSNFVREHGYAKAPNLTIAQFAKSSFVDTPAGHAARKYGGYNRPNFYVRTLTGLDRPGRPEAPIGPAELEQALDVLDQLDYVFTLDGDIQASKRRDMVGSDVPMPMESNNYWSTKNLRDFPDRVARLPETHSFRRRFFDENCPDIALYAAAQRRVELERSCVGCLPPPKGFFRTDVMHPRPDCLLTKEARAQPTLWEEFQAFWGHVESPYVE